jgi:hypothetical protein
MCSFFKFVYIALFLCFAMQNVILKISQADGFQLYVQLNFKMCKKLYINYILNKSHELSK